MIKELGTKNTALREKLQKYLYYHQTNKYEYFSVEEMSLCSQSSLIDKLDFS